MTLADLIVPIGVVPDCLDAVPLRVVCELAAPVVTYDEIVMLDGLLALGAYRIAQATLGPAAIPPLGHADRPLDWRLPLDTWREGDVWGWCASGRGEGRCGVLTPASHRTPPAALSCATCSRSGSLPEPMDQSAWSSSRPDQEGGKAFAQRGVVGQ